MTTTPKQKKPKRWELYQMEWEIPDLHIEEPVGVYPRQSTKKQLRNNRQSFEKQTQDSVKYLVRRGWDESLIRVYDQDMGMSGTLGIEDREGLNQTIADIRAGRIRTIYAAEVDRLFRDEDRIDSNVFIKICKEADCFVLTDRAIYNLRIPRHTDYFRDEIERAWKYFESQILIRAHQHLDRARSKGLKDYLRNRTLLGEYKYGDVWLEDNHPAIIPHDLWQFAQEALERMKAADTRTYYIPTPSVIYNLLHAAPLEEGQKQLVTRREDKGNYEIMEQRGFRQRLIASIDIDGLERIFLEKFTQRLQETDRFENYEDRLVGSEDKIQERRENLQDAIHELTAEIDGIFLTLKSPKLDSKQRDDFIEERARLMRRREALQQELDIQSPLQVYLKYKDLITLMGKYWERYPFEDRQALIALLVKKIYLTYLSPRFLQITIAWKEFPEDIGIIQRPLACSFRWTEEEDQIVREMYATASPQELLDALPRRPWEGIRNRARDLHVSRPLSMREKIPYRNVSKQDVELATQYDIPLEEITTPSETYITRWRWQHRWLRLESVADL